MQKRIKKHVFSLLQFISIYTTFNDIFFTFANLLVKTSSKVPASGASTVS